jgi:hypothetical protein
VSSNKSIRQQLEKIYGKDCMFQKARVAERLAQIEGVLTYHKFVEQQHYTQRKIQKLEKNMTLHHLQHVSEGGTTTVKNGANINEMAHRYLHNGLNREQEEIANNMLREYKECKVQLDDNFSPEFEVCALSIMISDNDVKIEPLERVKTEEVKEEEVEEPVQIVVEQSIDVYRDMTEEEIEEYKKYKEKRNKRIFEKFER